MKSLFGCNVPWIRLVTQSNDRKKPLPLLQLWTFWICLLCTPLQSSSWSHDNTVRQLDWFLDCQQLSTVHIHWLHRNLSELDGVAAQWEFMLHFCNEQCCTTITPTMQCPPCVWQIQSLTQSSISTWTMAMCFIMCKIFLDKERCNNKTWFLTPQFSANLAMEMLRNHLQCNLGRTFGQDAPMAAILGFWMRRNCLQKEMLFFALLCMASSWLPPKTLFCFCCPSLLSQCACKIGWKLCKKFDSNCVMICATKDAAIVHENMLLVTNENPPFEWNVHRQCNSFVFKVKITTVPVLSLTWPMRANWLLAHFFLVSGGMKLFAHFLVIAEPLWMWQSFLVLC